MSTWTPRDVGEHRTRAADILAAQTLASRSELESSLGIRYSELLRLPYFDPIRGHAVDPMHNLLLGTAKHTFAIWIKKGILDDSKIGKIDERMQQLASPSEVGRITQSMSLYKTMKAVEWQNWVLYFSLFCLKDLIKRQHFNMWQVFVRACYLLINTSISRDEVKQAHDLLILFCKTFQSLLGREHCTPNMHMHLHLASCVKDYGPIYSFWCYSFERYNGILGCYHTNNHAITITLARKFFARVVSHANFHALGIDGLPSLDSFGLNSGNDALCDVILLDNMRRLNHVNFEFIGKVYRLCSVAKSYCLSKAEVGEVVKLFAANGYSITLERFTQSHTKVYIGRILIKTRGFRGGDNKDHIVLFRQLGLDSEPAVVKVILIVTIYMEKDGNHMKFEVPLVKIAPFKEHVYKYWFGRNCPMKLWSTELKVDQLVFLWSLKRKCSFAKATQSFNKLDLAKGKQSRVKASDEVYFIT